MNRKLIFEIVSKINTFPSLPSVVSKVLEVTSTPESSIDDLLEVIAFDQSFAVSILKTANSAFYGRVCAVSSLKEAVTVLGRKEIRNIVITKAMFNRFKTTGKSEYFNIKKFWEHSFYCGLIAKIIAKDLGKDWSDFFIAGLIHDIGKLIIYFEMPDSFFEIMRASDNDLSKTFHSETEFIGITHDKLGQMLLKKWMFPENLISAVRFHHSPFEVDDDITFPIIIYISDFLAYYFVAPKADYVDGLTPEKIFTTDVIQFFKSCKNNWNLNDLQSYMETFEGQKSEISDILNMLLT